MSRLPSPGDFPVMRTPAHARRSFPGRTWATCSVCNLAIDPRNRARHVKACAKRRRLAPEMWAEWKKDMIDWGKS